MKTQLLTLIASAVIANAATPQMGWNDWNTFQCNVSADLLESSSDVIVNTGLRDLGYEYVVLDDCWSDGRDSDGKLKADTKKFPDGMKAVAQSMHSKGLKFGMYSSAGTETCAGYAGSLDHEEIDASTFASWEVDYLKYDNCNNQGQFGDPIVSFNRYDKMSKAIQNSGREIFYSLCNWGQDASFSWGEKIANSWRMSGDIGPSFNAYDDGCPCNDVDYYNCGNTGYHCSVMNILNKNALISSWPKNATAPGFQNMGGFNDMDMLEVGNGLTDDENMVHFSMWCMLKSPLLMGNDIRKMDAKSFSVLANPAAIAISQDPLGVSGHRVWRQFTGEIENGTPGELQVWSGELYGGDWVVALINADNKDHQIEATLSDIFYSEANGGAAPQASKSWDIYDIWGNRMSDGDANQILKDQHIGTAAKYTYNATAQSYEEGLKANDPKLLGKKIGSVNGGRVKAKVPSHGIAFYRLREQK